MIIIMRVSFMYGGKVFLCSLSFVLGIAGLYVMQVWWRDWTACNEKMYDLLNPHLPCGTAIQRGEWNYEPLRDLLTAKKAELKAAKKVSHISIYFRDLYNGPRFGIGEYDQFQPASLIKVPVMIAFLHEADSNPSLLNQKLVYTGVLDTHQNLEESDETIQPDIPYTVYELIRRMIVFSDNYASYLLVRELNHESKLLAYYTFRDLNILSMMLAPMADHVSIQEYATLFAVLHNTGYLSKEMSQLALEILSQSTFKGALVAGVPEGIRVAHKFGYRMLSKHESQLHDCGIVYHPATAYVLCVMTSGTDLHTEKSVIAEVSRMVYDSVSSLNLAY